MGDRDGKDLRSVGYPPFPPKLKKNFPSPSHCYRLSHLFGFDFNFTFAGHFTLKIIIYKDIRHSPTSKDQLKYSLIYRYGKKSVNFVDFP